jgi:hypothetical protein
MRSISFKIINALLIIDIGIIGFCIISGQRLWLYNTQIGFFSSAAVITASIMSYGNMVRNRLAHHQVLPEIERDELDKIDDPHDLYSEGSNGVDIDANRAEDDDEPGSHRRSISDVARDSKASFAFYRIGAYALLILGFFYLDRHEYLHIPSYLFALGVPPIVAVVLLLRQVRSLQSDLEGGGDHESRI